MYDIFLIFMSIFCKNIKMLLLISYINNEDYTKLFNISYEEN